MATKPSPDAAPDDEDEEDGEEGGEEKEAEPKKAGLVGRILGTVLAIPRLLNPLAFLKLSLMKKLMAGGGLIGIILAGGAVYYFLLSGPSEEETAQADRASVQTAPEHLPTATFFDIPDIIVNIQTPDSSQAYLKLSVALELDKPEAKLAVEPVLPRIVDQFQSYLRELRVEDIRGSAGVMRLKEELLRRVNLAVAPTPVRDVLLKEMIVQ